MDMIRTAQELELIVGENFRLLRLQKNLPQRALAAQAGVSLNALRHLEAGSGARLATLIRVARALNKQDWLLSVAPQTTLNPLHMVRSRWIRRGLLRVCLRSYLCSQRIELAPLHMPLNESEKVLVFTDLPEETYRRLPAMLADALPDDFGNALIDRYMAERGVPRFEITALDRLAYMGNRAMGALEFNRRVALERERLRR